jgi:O-antigen/teichoic acid export membrane protein
VLFRGFKSSFPEKSMTVTERSDTLAEVNHLSLVAKARTGTIWTIIAYACAQTVRLGSSILLSRLFMPQYFGLMALLNTLMIGLTLFSDVGLLPSVIRSEKGDDPRYLNTVWTVQVFRGIGLWIVCAALSWPFAKFYNDPRLLALAPVTGLSLILIGFTSTSVLTFGKHMEVRKNALLELFVQVVQLVVTVLVAVANPSIWALVVGRLAADAARLVVSHFLIPGYRNRFAWDKETVRELLSFGKWIFASTALAFLASQSDRLVLGKLVSMTTLGLYGIGFALADIPRQVIMAFRGYVGLPFVSGFSRLPRFEFRAVVLRYRRLVLLVSAVLLALGVNFSDLFLIHVYDKRYHAAAWIVPILALGLWHTILYSTSSPCLTMLGKVSYNVYGYILTAAVLLLAVPATFHIWGLIGAVWIISFSDFPVYLCNLIGLWREQLSTFKQDLELTLTFGACTLGLFFLRAFIGFPWSHPVNLR